MPSGKFWWLAVVAVVGSALVFAIGVKQVNAGEALFLVTTSLRDGPGIRAVRPRSPAGATRPTPHATSVPTGPHAAYLLTTDAASSRTQRSMTLLSRLGFLATPVVAAKLGSKRSDKLCSNRLAHIRAWRDHQKSSANRSWGWFFEDDIAVPAGVTKEVIANTLSDLYREPDVPKLAYLGGCFTSIPRAPLDTGRKFFSFCSQACLHAYGIHGEFIDVVLMLLREK